jgi:hypothetical protein
MTPEPQDKRRSYDAELAKIHARLESGDDNFKQVNDKLDSISDHIAGNGRSPGIFTRLALTEASLARVWWWLGGVSFCLLGIAIRAFVL